MWALPARSPCLELDDYLLEICWNCARYLVSTCQSISGQKVVLSWNLNLATYNTFLLILLFLNCSYVFAQSDTEVTVVWAYRTSSDADSSLSKHNKSGILNGTHNLIQKAMSQEGTSPIPTKSAGVIGPCFSSYIVLACLSVYLCLSF